jgi:hypothetical protein
MHRDHCVHSLHRLVYDEHDPSEWAAGLDANDSRLPRSAIARRRRRFGGIRSPESLEPEDLLLCAAVYDRWCRHSVGPA